MTSQQHRKRCFVLDPTVPGRVLAYIGTNGTTKLVDPEGEEGLPPPPLLDEQTLIATGEFAFPRFWVQVPLDRLVYTLPSLNYFQSMLSRSLSISPKVEIFIFISDIPSSFHSLPELKKNTYSISLELAYKTSPLFSDFERQSRLIGALHFNVVIERFGRPPSHSVASVIIDDFTQQLRTLRGGLGLFPSLCPPNPRDPQTAAYLATRLSLIKEYEHKGLAENYTTRRDEEHFPYDIRTPKDRMWVFPSRFAWEIVGKLQEAVAATGTGYKERRADHRGEGGEKERGSVSFIIFEELDPSGC